MSGNLVLVETQLGMLLAGLRSKLAADGKFSLAGVSHTREELAKTVEGYLGLFKATREARETMRKLAHERDLRTPELRIFLKEIRSLLNTQFGMESSELLEFGFAPRHRRAQATTTPREQKPAT